MNDNRILQQIEDEVVFEHNLLAWLESIAAATKRIADALECINPPGVSDTICVAPDSEALAVLREIHECLATTSEHGDLTAIISPDLYRRIKALTGPCDQCKHKEIS